MELTAFTSRLGEGQGLLGPGVFVLGDDQPGRTFEFEHGDHVEVTQVVDLTGVTLVRTAPLGDPIEIKVRGYHLTLRKSEADHILVEPAA